jgi:hypothetical protein
MSACCSSDGGAPPLPQPHNPSDKAHTAKREIVRNFICDLRWKLVLTQLSGQSAIMTNRSRFRNDHALCAPAADGFVKTGSFGWPGWTERSGGSPGRHGGCIHRGLGHRGPGHPHRIETFISPDGRPRRLQYEWRLWITDVWRSELDSLQRL